MRQTCQKCNINCLERHNNNGDDDTDYLIFIFFLRRRSSYFTLPYSNVHEEKKTYKSFNIQRSFHIPYIIKDNNIIIFENVLENKRRNEVRNEYHASVSSIQVSSQVKRKRNETYREKNLYFIIYYVAKACICKGKIQFCHNHNNIIIKISSFS